MASRPLPRSNAVFLGVMLGLLANSWLFAATGEGGGHSDRIVVAIDPGHGGTNLGAAGTGRGVYEKAVTLALAERVRSLLTDEAVDATSAAHSPEVTVVLCRTTDDFVPIRARSRCAREAGARLFLSLHANAVPAGVAPGSQRGFEVFVLGPREIEDDATLAALGESDDASAIWRAHSVRASGEASITLAGMVADHLSQVLGAEANRGVKQSGAALDVLRGVGTAAALVEIGFLDHPEEGTHLASPSSREPIARALAAAIQSYVSARPAGQRAAHGRSHQVPGSHASNQQP